ncbi:hypothetical protein JCM14076_02500 [Methylosoma difficile]
MDEQINFNLTQVSTWKRIFFMLIFSAIGGLVRMLLWAVIFIQVASALVTGKPNENILNFARSLSVYTYHILLFMTFNTETLPFPFSDWNLTADLQVPESNTTIRKAD